MVSEDSEYEYRLIVCENSYFSVETQRAFPERSALPTRVWRAGGTQACLQSRLCAKHAGAHRAPFRGSMHGLTLLSSVPSVSSSEAGGKMSVCIWRYEYC